MAKPTNKERGQKFLEQYADKVLDAMGIDPEKRAAARTSLLGVDEFVESLGRDALRHDEYSREMDAVRAADERVKQTAAQQLAWWNDHQGDVARAAEAQKLEAEVKRLRAAVADPDGEPPVSSPPPIDLTAYVRKDEALKIASDMQTRAAEESLQVFNTISRLGFQHYRDFGQVLDPDELVAHARKLGKPLTDAYADLTREASTTLATKRAADDRAKLRAEVLAEVQKDLGPGYPVGMHEPGRPSTLAGLKDPKAYGVEAALDAFGKGELRGS